MFPNLGSFDGGLFDDFRRLQREMDQMFGTTQPNALRAVARGSYPPINVGSTPEQVDVYLFAAGLDPKSLDISIQQNLLTLAGERRQAQSEERADYYRKERFDGGFRRVLTLPDDVDPDQVEARYRDGVLQITIQRSGASRPRKIEIH